MRNFIFAVIFELALFSFLLIFLPSALISRRLGVFNPGSSDLIELTANRPISFSFVSPNPNLSSLSLLMKNPQLKNHSPFYLTVSSLNSQRSASFSGSNVGDPSWLNFNFLPFITPAFSQFKVFVSTPDPYTQALYLLADDRRLPAFKTTYHQANVKNNLITNFWHQWSKLEKRSLAHTILYFCFVIFLTYHYLKK